MLYATYVGSLKRPSLVSTLLKYLDPKSIQDTGPDPKIMGARASLLGTLDVQVVPGPVQARLHVDCRRLARAVVTEQS